MKQNRPKRKNSFTLDVQITSRRFMFIQLSQLTKCPLYVSPFLSSTNYRGTEIEIRGVIVQHVLKFRETTT